MPDEAPARRIVDNFSDRFGVPAWQAIAARDAADTAVARGDLDALTAAFDQMGVPSEDDPAFLARMVMALPAEVRRRRLDQLELMNTRSADQYEVLQAQRSRSPAAQPTPAAPAHAHPASRAAAATVDRPTKVASNGADRASGSTAEVVGPSPGRPSSSTDRQPPKR